MLPLALLIRAQTVDNDLWGHLLFGLQVLKGLGLPQADFYSWTALGAPWIDHEWLSETLLAAAYLAGGVKGMLLLRALLFAALAFAYDRLVRLGGPSRESRVLVFCAGLTGMGLYFNFRPHTATYLFLVLELHWVLCFFKTGSRLAYALPLLFMLWANMHGGFILGLGVFLLLLAAHAVQGPKERRLCLRLAPVLVLCTAAVLCNPYGAEFPASVLRFMSNRRTYGFITEWHPYKFVLEPVSLMGLAYVVLASGVLYSSHRRMRWTEKALLALGLALVLAARRNIPVAWVLGAYPLARHETALSELFARLRPRAILALQAAAVLFFAFFLWGRRHSLTGLYYSSRIFPAGPSRFMERNRLSGRLWNPFDSGEYLLWHLHRSGVLVGIDGRYDTVYPEEVYMRSHLLNASKITPDEAAGHADYVLMKKDAAASRMMGRPWKPLYEDRDFVLFGRKARKGLLREEKPLGEGMLFP